MLLHDAAGCKTIISLQTLRGNMLMIDQNRNVFATKEPGRRLLFTNKHQGYYAAVPADLLDYENSIIDELIGFAFDTLGAWHLDVRVYDRTATKAPVEAERPTRVSGA